MEWNENEIAERTDFGSDEKRDEMVEKLDDEMIEMVEMK